MEQSRFLDLLRRILGCFGLTSSAEVRTALPMPAQEPSAAPARLPVAAPAMVAPRQPVAAEAEAVPPARPETETGTETEPQPQPQQPQPLAPVQAAPAKTMRSLEEVRADLARLRASAKERHARATVPVARESSFAPTDFMDLGPPQPAAQRHDSEEAEFAATSYLDFGAVKPRGG